MREKTNESFKLSGLEEEMRNKKKYVNYLYKRAKEDGVVLGKEEIEDIVHSAFLSVIKRNSEEKITIKKMPGAYIMTAVKNKYVDFLRRKGTEEKCRGKYYYGEDGDGNEVTAEDRVDGEPVSLLMSLKIPRLQRG